MDLNRIPEENADLQRRNWVQKNVPRLMFILLALFVSVTWQALSGFVLHFDGAARVPTCLILTAGITAIFVFPPLSTEARKSLTVLGLLLVYHIVNLILQENNISSFNENLLDLSLAFLNQWMFFFVLLHAFRLIPRQTIRVLIFGFVLIVLLYLQVNLVKYEGTEFERSTSTVINANNLAFICIGLLCLLSCMFLQKRIRPLPFLCLVLGVIYVQIGTACRTAFICLLPLSIGVAWSSFKNISVKKRGLFLTICIALFALTASFVEDSSVYRRLQNRENEYLLPELENSRLVWIFGERAIYFVRGYKVFEENPVFGVGYGNYGIYADSKFRNHVEYMAQLSEGGIVGELLYLCFLVTLAVPALKGRRGNRKSMITKLTFWVVLLIFNFGLFTILDKTFYVIAALLFMGGEYALGNSDRQ